MPSPGSLPFAPAAESGEARTLVLDPRSSPFGASVDPNSPHARAATLRADLARLRQAREGLVSGASIELSYRNWLLNVEALIPFPADLVRQSMTAKLEQTRAELRLALIEIRDAAVAELDAL